jgi:hypothetical protein
MIPNPIKNAKIEKNHFRFATSSPGTRTFIPQRPVVNQYASQHLMFGEDDANFIALDRSLTSDKIERDENLVLK